MQPSRPSSPKFHHHRHPVTSTAQIGTVQGDLLVLNSASMRVQTIVKKAHLGFVTALAFSQDSKALVSVSMDSSARVTIITEKTTNGSRYGLWLIMFMIVLAFAAYALKVKS